MTTTICKRLSIKKYSVRDSEKQFVFLLPEEILEMIFNKLQQLHCTSSDILNVSNAHSQFSRILHPQKCIWYFEEILPRVFPLLKASDTLNCRLVCHTWNRFIVKFLQNHPCFRDEHLIDPLEKEFLNPLAAYRCATTLSTTDLGRMDILQVSKIKSILNGVRNNFVNPTLLRRIFLGNEDELFYYYWDHAIELATIFGPNIFQIQLDGNSTYHPPILDKYEMLNKILHHLPNLTFLALSGYFYGKAKKGMRHRLEQSFYTNPLPDLPKLKTLQLFTSDVDVDPLGLIIIHEIVRKYSGQLKKLRIDVDLLNVISEKCYNLDCLSDLKLDQCSDNMSAKVVLSKLCISNLHKLSLMGTCLYEFIVLDCLPSHCPMIQYLSLQFIDGDDFADMKLFAKASAVSHTKVFSVTTLEIIASRDFYRRYNLNALLLLLPNLRHILLCSDHLIGNYDEANEFEEKTAMTRKGMGSFHIWQCKEKGEMFKCFVWDLLNKLEKCSFGKLGDSDLEYEIVYARSYKR